MQRERNLHANTATSIESLCAAASKFPPHARHSFPPKKIEYNFQHGWKISPRVRERGHFPKLSDVPFTQGKIYSYTEFREQKNIRTHVYIYVRTSGLKELYLSLRGGHNSWLLFSSCVSPTAKYFNIWGGWLSSPRAPPHTHTCISIRRGEPTVFNDPVTKWVLTNFEIIWWIAFLNNVHILCKIY